MHTYVQVYMHTVCVCVCVCVSHKIEGREMIRAPTDVTLQQDACLLPLLSCLNSCVEEPC